ncbi:glycosyltransferase family 39 protein [Candidatus Woesearchaeota archaeon]|nr:glycosyltransferase family 39 protein [Candidatus Woesearchaeota archaeon]
MRREHKILVAIFFSILIFRLIFAFLAPNYDYEAYFNIRQIDNIARHGLPIYYDELSYGGRTFLFTPVFHYVLALFYFISPVFALKILPNIFATSLVFIIYPIAKKLTNNINISLFTAFISAFIPIYIMNTVNAVSVYSVMIPLFFLMVYFLMNLTNKKNINYFVILILVLPLIHFSAILFVLSLVFYLIFIRIEHLKQKRNELEVILFAIFFIAWLYFLIFKNALLFHGPAVIWRNVPSQIISVYFGNVSLLESLLKIGFISFVSGIYVVYRYAFREKDKNIYLLIGIVLSIVLLIWGRMIQPAVGLMFLGVTLTLLFSRFFKLFFRKLSKTKFADYKKHIFIAFIVLFIITSVIPSFYYTKEQISSAPSENVIEAFEWIYQNSNKNDTILATVSEGYAINFIAKRKNIADNNFLLIKDVSQKIEDVHTLYKTLYKIDAIRLLNKYGARYIVFSKEAENQFNIEWIKYINLNEDCFDLAYAKEDIQVYESLCEVEE